jgi:hypothetical protein
VLRAAQRPVAWDVLEFGSYRFIGKRFCVEKSNMCGKLELFEKLKLCEKSELREK